MITFKGEETVFYHNSDMSGECIITNLKTGETINILCTDILLLVSQYILSQKISNLENSDPMTILGINEVNLNDR